MLRLPHELSLDDEHPESYTNVESRRFEIPSRDDDLLVNSSCSYVVRNGDMSQSQVKGEFLLFSSRLERGEWQSICDHFDALFTLSKYNSAINNWSLRLQALEYLIHGFNTMKPDLQSCIARVLHCDGIPPKNVLDNCVELSDILLMTVYLMYRLLCHFEPELLKRQKAAAAGKKYRSADTECDEEMKTWLSVRMKILDAFSYICQMSMVDGEGKTRQGAIRYLWRPPEANKGMLRTFMETIFKLLEHPDNARVSGRNWLTAIFKFTRLVCIKFEYFHRMAGALVEKTIHFDYMKEATMLHYPFIDAINIVAVKNDMDTLLSHMIHYVGGLGPLDFSGKSSPRPYALFIQAMAEKAPHVLVNHLTSIVMYLDNDPYILRSAVLTAFCDLVCSTVLTEESCRNSSRLMKARDKMLDKLQDHLTDSNAQVRAKVLHLWTKLAQCKRIPKKRLKRGLISSIVPRFILCRRLSDKSVMARKAAVQFMATFLVQNPYGHDFSFNLNRDQLLSKLERRDKLMKCNPENRVVATAFQKFSEVETVIRETAKKWIEKYKEGPVENDMEDTETSLVIAAIVGQLLYDTIKAVRVFVQLAFVGKLPNVNATDPTNVVVNNLVDSLRDLYVRDRIASHIQNDEECLEIEENQKDYDLAMQKINADIDWLKNKLIVELEMEQCVPHALRGVIQGELSEMKEGIKFVVECKNFMIRGADAAVRSLCSLIWRNSQEIRKEVLEAAGKMFLSKNPKLSVQHESTAENLMNVVEGIQEAERSCVEEVICLMACETPFPSGVLKKIWKTLSESSCSDKQLVSLRLLSILARADKDGLRSRLRSFQKLVREGNPQIAYEALCAIANLASGHASSNVENICQSVLRIPARDSLFTTIDRFVLNEMMRFDCENVQWFSVMQAALSVYFEIAKDTCIVVGRLVSKALWYTRRISDIFLFYDNKVKMNDNTGEVIKERRLYWMRAWICVTERMLALSGEVAMRCVIHTDVTYVKEVKRMAEVIAYTAKGEIVPEEAPNRTLKEWEWRSAMHKGIFDFSDADKLGITGVSEEERIRSRSTAILDSKLLRQGRLLSRLLPFVVYCLRAESSSPRIRNAAALAFSKFILISRDMAERGSMLFFSLLNNSPYPMVRNNMMVAAADFSFRFPNTVEKYAQDVYAMAKDDDPRVRETCILVLTYLTTNDMLKMHGALADSARCFLDPVPSIANLTRLFFNELGKKGSVIYNLMPDFISRLSRNSREMPLPKFKIIFHHLVKLLKDKHADALVEKICHRFELAKSTHGTAKNRDLALYFSFCVSLFPLNDRSFYKVRDALPVYSSFLEDQRIYNDFLSSLQPLIRTTKNIDVKNDAEEFERQLGKLHIKGLGSEDLHQSRFESVKNTKEKPRCKRGRPPRVITRQKKLRSISRSESELDYIDED